MRVDATAEAAKRHPLTWGRCVTSSECIGECLAEGDSTVLRSNGLPVPLAANTVEHRDGKVVGAWERVKVVSPEDSGESSCWSQGAMERTVACSRTLEKGACRQKAHGSGESKVFDPGVEPSALSQLLQLVRAAH